MLSARQWFAVHVATDKAIDVLDTMTRADKGRPHTFCDDCEFVVRQNVELSLFDYDRHLASPGKARAR